MKVFRLILKVVFILAILGCDDNLDRFSGIISKFNTDLKPEKIDFISGFGADTEKGKCKYIGVDIVHSPIIEKMTEKERKFNASNYALGLYNCLDSAESNSDMVVRITLTNEKSQNYDHQLSNLKIYKRSFKLVDKFFESYKLQNAQQTFDLYSQDMITKNKEALNTIFAHINETYDSVQQLEMLGYDSVTNSKDEIKVNVGVTSKKGFFLWVFDFRIIDNDIKIDGLNI